MLALNGKVKRFVHRVKEIYQDAQIFLFGSRARGDYLEDSDWDFIIVSNNFEGEDFVDRISTVLKKTKANFAAEILCYTPKEFKKKKGEIGTVQTAMRDAIPL